MVSINGKGNDYNKILIAQEAMKKAEAKKAAQAEENVPVAKQKTKELGDDLLDPRLFANAVGFVRQTTPIAKADADMLTEMYAIAGIKTQLPTKEQYDRVAAGTLAFAGNVDNIRAEYNTEKLFASPDFQKLNEQFGIA